GISVANSLVTSYGLGSILSRVFDLHVARWLARVAGGTGRQLRKRSPHLGIPRAQENPVKSAEVTELASSFRGSAVAAILVLGLLLGSRVPALEWKGGSGHGPQAVGHLSALGRVPGSERLYWAIAFPLRHSKELTSLPQRLYALNSPKSRRFLT